MNQVKAQPSTSSWILVGIGLTTTVSLYIPISWCVQEIRILIIDSTSYQGSGSPLGRYRCLAQAFLRIATSEQDYVVSQENYMIAIALMRLDTNRPCLGIYCSMFWVRLGRTCHRLVGARTIRSAKKCNILLVSGCAFRRCKLPQALKRLNLRLSGVSNASRMFFFTYVAANTQRGSDRVLSDCGSCSLCWHVICVSNRIILNHMALCFHLALFQGYFVGGVGVGWAFCDIGVWWNLAEEALHLKCPCNLLCKSEIRHGQMKL